MKLTTLRAILRPRELIQKKDHMKLPSILKLASLLPFFALLSACASITRGSSEDLLVTSVPSNASVKVIRVNGELTKLEIKKNTYENEPGVGPMIGVTPTSFSLLRKGVYKLSFEKEGYKPKEVLVTNEVTPMGGAGVAGNAIFGGLLGVAIDASSGAMKDLTPNPVEVVLEKE